MRLQIRLLSTLLMILLTAMVMLLPVLPVSAASVPVTLSKFSGSPGTEVVAIGTTFTAGSTYTVTFGVTTAVATVVATGMVPAGGEVYAPFSVPILPRGIYNITITTPVDGTAVPVPSFTITPQISISTASGAVADQISISGNGFNPSQSITILFDNITLTPVTSNSQGVFSNAIVTIPQAPFGSHVIIAKDLNGSSPSVTFSITSKISLSADKGNVGSTISTSGNGFAASSKLSFFVDDLSIDSTATTDSTGKFSDVSLMIPAIAGGTHTIKIQDAKNNSVTANFLISPSISVRPDKGPANTNVTITGNGFIAIANNPIVINYNGAIIATNPAPVTADGNGYFSTSFKIPYGSSGIGTIVARDAVNTSSVNFTTIATTAINPTSGPVGTIITANGAGFKANTAITIKYGNSPAGTATTDSEGNFSTTFPALASSTGNHQITITDQTNTMTFTFGIVSDVKISPASGFVGSDVTINGTGFSSSAGVTVKYDANQIASSTTDADGTFTVVFKAPASEGGNHQITIADSLNITTSAFVIDSTPPPTPALLEPPPMTKADKRTSLDWQDVTDPSGITYTLQISKDATFDTVILQKRGLISSEYELTKQEVLNSVSKNTPYYWRVKAIDRANNESQWSSPFSFYVGFFLAKWTYYTIVGVSALIVGLICYWLERRRVR
jgi:hypothetical protein